MRGTFFRESPPSPQRTCWKATEVRSCLAAFCLRQNFGVFCRGLKGMQASPFHPRAKSPGIFPAGENSVPRQGLKAFNLKAVFAYRANALVKPNAHRMRSLYFGPFSKFRSSLFKGLRNPKAEPLVVARRRRNPLYRVSFCLAFSLRVLPAKKKRRCLYTGNRPVKRQKI